MGLHVFSQRGMYRRLLLIGSVGHLQKEGSMCRWGGSQRHVRALWLQDTCVLYLCDLDLGYQAREWENTSAPPVGNVTQVGRV